MITSRFALDPPHDRVAPRRRHARGLIAAEMRARLGWLALVLAVRARACRCRAGRRTPRRCRTARARPRSVSAQPAHRVLRRRVRRVAEHADERGRRRDRARGGRASARSSTARPRGPRGACRSSRPPSARGRPTSSSCSKYPGRALARGGDQHVAGSARFHAAPPPQPATAVRSVTSAAATPTEAPGVADATASWAAASRSGSRASSDTRAPRAASASAVARPMPLDPPVISSVRAVQLRHGPMLSCPAVRYRPPFAGTRAVRTRHVQPRGSVNRR